jgi:hypothetical protein
MFTKQVTYSTHILIENIYICIPPPKIFLYMNKTKQKVDPAPCTHKNENILHKIANFW